MLWQRIKRTAGLLLLGAEMLLYTVVGMVLGVGHTLRKHKHPKAPRRILIFAFMGLGDAIMMLPMLRLIKAAFPHTSITALTTLPSPAHEILTLSGCVEEILFFNFKQASARERWNMNSALQERNFDAVLCSYIAPLPYFIRAVSGIPIRIGHTFPQHSWRNPSFGALFSHPIALHPDDHRHETERYRMLGAALVQHFLYQPTSASNQDPTTLSALEALCNEHITEAAIALHPHTSLVDEARRILHQWGIMPDMPDDTPHHAPHHAPHHTPYDVPNSTVNDVHHPIIGIHPAVGATQPWRQWGIEHFVAVAYRLMIEYHASILLFGSDADIPLLSAMQQQLQSLLHASDTAGAFHNSQHTAQPSARVFLITPSTTSTLLQTDVPHHTTRLPLEETMGFLQHCHVVLANDGGIAHLANACGVPTVRIFGMTDYHGYKTLNEELHTDLWLGLPCSPCMGLGVIKRTNNALNLATCGHHNCLRLVEEEAVFRAVQHKLENNRANILRSTSSTASHSSIVT